MLEGPRVRALLAGQQADGGFGVNVYGKWGGAHWRLVSLVELGVPAGEPRCLAAAETVLAWLTGQGHRDRIQTIDGLARRCGSQEGNALAVCCRLGLAGRPARPAARGVARRVAVAGRRLELRQEGERATAPRSTSRCRRCGGCTSTGSPTGETGGEGGSRAARPSSSSSIGSSARSRTGEPIQPRPSSTHPLRRRSGTTTFFQALRRARADGRLPATRAPRDAARPARASAARPGRPLAAPAARWWKAARASKGSNVEVVEGLQHELAAAPRRSPASAERLRRRARTQPRTCGAAIPLGRARGEARDDLGEHARVGRDRVEPRLRARGGVVGEPARLLDAVHRRRSRRRRAGRRRSGRAGRARRRTPARPAARLRAPRRPRARTPTEAENSAPVFSRCSAARSAVSPVTSRYWPPIIPSVACASSRPTIGVG